MHHQQQRQKRPWLQVLQASPIARIDPRTGETVPAGQLDLQGNRKVFQGLFQEFGRGTGATVDFDIATPDSLGAILSSNAVYNALHIVCHGNEACLMIENEWGLEHRLSVEHLCEWLVASPTRFKLVFVSACASWNIAQAFINAGVPNVVMSPQHELSTVLAHTFTKAFYRALLQENTIHQAFELANCELRSAYPTFASKQHFMLLGDVASHQERLFCARRPTLGGQTYHQSTVLPSSTTSPMQSPSLKLSFPIPPDYFLRSDLTVYNILKEMKTKRLVIVTGPRGVGKSTVVQECCRFLEMRLSRTVRFEEIAYYSLDAGQPLLASEGQRSSIHLWHLTKAFACLREGEEVSPDVLLNIKTSLKNRQTLIVIEAKTATSPSMAALWSFLKEILKDTTYVTILLTQSLLDSPLEPLGSICAAARVQVNPMNFESTVKMFALCCHRISTCAYPALQDGRTLWSLWGPHRNQHVISLRHKLIFETIGNGFPGRLKIIANTMNEDEFYKLMCLGYYRELDSVESRIDLLRWEHGVKGDILASEVGGDRETKEILCQQYKALQVLKPKLPLLSVLAHDFHDHCRKFIAAQDRMLASTYLVQESMMQENLSKETQKIIEWVTEEMAWGHLANGKGSSSKIADILDTRFFLDHLMKLLTIERAKCSSVDHFHRADGIDSMLGALKEATFARPSLEDLKKMLLSFSEELAHAETRKDSDAMLIIRSKHAELSKQLRKEQLARIDDGASLLEHGGCGSESVTAATADMTASVITESTSLAPQTPVKKRPVLFEF